jgi:GH15 family glucan-1,4-alpha-glucosidase
VLRALTDRRTGAVAAGPREGWAYVWPRDAAAVALALAAAGLRADARRIASFLLRLDLGEAARFDGMGEPVDGRAAQGDALGWAAAAARAAGMPDAAARLMAAAAGAWRGRADYQEKSAGEHLANAIASGAPLAEFTTARGLARVAGDPSSGLDSAAAWAVRPFARPAHLRRARSTLRRLAHAAGPYGIVPSEDWPGQDPWTAPTAWSAWGLAALSRAAGRAGRPAVGRRDRRAALRLMAALRRAATPLGTLPERVDAETGLPTSTTPLAWSHAFAILALRELWPPILARDAGPRSHSR